MEGTHLRNAGRRKEGQERGNRGWETSLEGPELLFPPPASLIAVLPLYTHAHLPVVKARAH